MRLLCAFLLLLTVSATRRHASFRGHFRGYPMCRSWECLHGKYNFTDVLPQRDQYSDFLKGLLPAEWHMHADTAVDKCYEFEATLDYTNTCPGQGLLHCVVDKLVQGCPSEYWQSRDGCSPVASLAGINIYMFSQSRYENLRANLPLEIRPAGLLFDPFVYFRSKCCDLPQLFNGSLLSECGFTEMLHYIDRKPDLNTAFRYGPSIQDVTNKETDGNMIGEVFNFHMLPESTTSSSSFEYSTIADEDNQGEADEEIQDALDCCEQIDDFIHPDWKAECDFKLKWDSTHRLTNRNYTDEMPLNTTEQCKDLTPATSCVLNKMGLLNYFGFIDHFRMKGKIREYSNYKPSYLYEVFNSAFLFTPTHGDLCDSPRKLFNLLEAMLLVCDPSKRRTNRQCSKMFTEITNSVSNKTRETLHEIHRNSIQNSAYVYDRCSLSRIALSENQNLYFPRRSTCSETKQNSSKTKFSITSNNKRYDFGVLGLLGTPPPVDLIDLKPKNKTLVLLPVYQRTPKNDPLAINSLNNDGVLRG